MAAIKSKDTKPEMIVRRGLWKRGFRYRLNHKRLPGHPDLVLRKYRTCIFVNGCFWHGHGATLNEEGEMRSEKCCCKIPKTNREFWVAKIQRNKERDKEEQRKLAEMGWHCITVWECELKASKREETLDSIAFTLNHIFLQDRKCQKADVESQMEEEDLQMMRQILPIVVAALLLAACVDIEEHKLYMERVNDQWLISDFDGHKKECIRYLANKRK